MGWGGAVVRVPPCGHTWPCVPPRRLYGHVATHPPIHGDPWQLPAVALASSPPPDCWPRLAGWGCTGGSRGCHPAACVGLQENTCTCSARATHVCVCVPVRGTGRRSSPQCTQLRMCTPARGVCSPLTPPLPPLFPPCCVAPRRAAPSHPPNAPRPSCSPVPRPHAVAWGIATASFMQLPVRYTPQVGPGRAPPSPPGKGPRALCVLPGANQPAG